ncbi:MAG: hypothetical protein U9N49_06750 [Campylobacterota bacterium]|nr:hypothetical protein [Campylobacterota bacterium]
MRKTIILIITLTLLVSNEPEPKAVEILNGLEIVDMQYDGDLYLLTSDNKVYIIDSGNINRPESIKQIVELGDVSNPQGFHIARGLHLENNFEAQDIYIADTGNNRIVRYLEVDNYQRDPNYEIRYDFNQPVDVTAGTLRKVAYLSVLDKGNNRVVEFENEKFKQSYTAQGSLNGALQNPVSFIGRHLLDRDGALLREIYFKYEKASENRTLDINSFHSSKFGKLCDEGVDIMADEGAKELLVTFKGIELEKRIKLDCSPTMAVGTGFGEEFDKSYFACKEQKGLFYIQPYLKPKGARAIDIAQQFVEAIKQKERFKLLKLSMMNAKLLLFLDLGFLNDVLKKTTKTVVARHSSSSVVVGYYSNYTLDDQKIKVLIHLHKANGTFVKSSEWYVDDVMVRPIKPTK